jgi:membrane-bound lytic murein transglycosylase
MVTTWIFPLAIVLSLPYDSLHSHRFFGTATAILNWMGSPQTALTATIFNFHQIRKAHRRAKHSPSAYFSTWNDLYYVISCLNQFDVTSRITENDTDFFKVLVYGLFSPILSHQQDAAGKYTKSLLSVMAHQLRMHRRRALIPTMLNLGTFLIALVFSIVLSFAQVGEHTKVDMLVLGLLFTWLPMLVIFTNVDRTPVSADRTR